MGSTPTKSAFPPLRVLTSVCEPTPETNPYITMLVAALRSTDDLELSTFSRVRALIGRYDVLHVHWPETLVRAGSWHRRVAKRIIFCFIILRLMVTRTPVVETVHNLKPHEDGDRLERILLRRLKRLTVHCIVLNLHTPLPDGLGFTHIPHGHYRDWYAKYSEGERISGRLQYVGLLRRYKGVEELIQAFRALDDPNLSLGVAGLPVDGGLALEIEAAAAKSGGIALDLRFLDDREFVRVVTEAELICLPYRAGLNSGAALAALSLCRPVLVRDSATNRDLAEEVGAGWVHFFDDTITGEDIVRALRDSRATLGCVPDLSRREWDDAGRAHLRAFRAAVMTRRALKL